MSSSSNRHRGKPKTKFSNTSSGEDAALDSIARRAEELLQEKRKERERARRIRLKELEKKQREDDDSLDRQYAIDKTTVSRTYASSNPSSLSSAGKDDTRSRKSSIDSIDSTDGLTII
ncbi:hypothetical protein EB796_020934 [Bugula neritina]|uniref:Uncharacterized protein n=1 Tax=Bugula neritina TaxID=10212 RepID=A0A7J7J5R1_BUGNE|nr:hypothetical protein EB796_020934 [Bugula neritina]